MYYVLYERLKIVRKELIILREKKRALHKGMLRKGLRRSYKKQTKASPYCWILYRVWWKLSSSRFRTRSWGCFAYTTWRGGWYYNKKYCFYFHMKTIITFGFLIWTWLSTYFACCFWPLKGPPSQARENAPNLSTYTCIFTVKFVSSKIIRSGGPGILLYLNMMQIQGVPG